ncbi:MarR family winged helix-turn-helix transcriptional regulator [Streptomyces caniscabiei]|uniref:MarR family winged helix-turn-helix transcriptional regulator n=1 Tax=Streptomyces caniscabiei TaxID=2746961 RepID=UPI000765F494|nr:MarR family transcriptional regulator [Streptomyces caniscabiei]
MSQAQPDRAENRQEGTDDLHFWSFIDHAVAMCSRELPDIDPVSMRLVQTLFRVANMIVYDMESTVHRPRGLSWGGFRILFAVWTAGPLEPKKAAELTGMSRAAVSALVTTLERDGLVTRTRAPHDGRSVLLGMSEQGRTVIADAFRSQNAREKEWADAFDEDDRRTLIALLEKLTAHSVDVDARHRA